MALNYGTTAIPGDSYSVIQGGTINVGAAFERSVGLVGGMDTANGTATPGETVEVSSTADAIEKFGDGSELHRQVSLAFNNGAVTVYAYPVTETTGETESFSSTQSGTLSNIPFNPEIQAEHEITAQDTTEGQEADVNIVYEDAPSAPTTSNTINLNPVTGEWQADASSSYDITYDYGDYGTAAIDGILDEEPRRVALLRETSSDITSLATELTARADNFVFGGGVGGAVPFEDPSNPSTSGYTDSIDEERISLVASPYGYIDAAETDMQRTTGAVAAELVSLPLGESATNNSLSGFTGLRTDLTPSQAGDLIDEQVLPLIDYPPVTIVKDMTTSTTQKFERAYVMDVVDEATEVSHRINRQFVGEQNTSQNRNQLARSHKNSYKGFTTSTPRLLDDYAVRVEEDSVDRDQVNVHIGLDVVDIMDNIEVTMTVGDVVNPAEVS